MQIFIVIGLCSEYILMDRNGLLSRRSFCVTFNQCSVKQFTKGKELTYTKRNWDCHANLVRKQSCVSQSS